jgi:hypothetical protein
MNQFIFVTIIHYEIGAIASVSAKRIGAVLTLDR